MATHLGAASLRLRFAVLLTLLGLIGTVRAQLPAAAARPGLVSDYVDVTCRYARGQVTVVRVVPGRFATPTLLKRFLGRFEARVVAGERTLEVVRFDFPLLADADAGVQGHLAERLKAYVTSVATVRVPLPAGAEGLEIVDRRGGARIPYSLRPAAADGGVAPSAVSEPGR